MVEKHLFHRRAVLKGTLALAGGGIAGLRSGPLLAQSTPGVTDKRDIDRGAGAAHRSVRFHRRARARQHALAVEKINEAGGINGRKLRLIFEHASTPAESVAAAKKLVENDKVFVLVIASGSTGAAAAADYVRSAQIPTYNTVGATPIIRDPFARNVFHGTIPPASVTGQAMIDIGFQAVANATRVGILAGTYAFPQSHLAEIKPRLEKRGGVEVVVEQFDAAASDFTAQLVSFVRRRVQVVLILGSFTEAGFAIKQAPEKGLTNVMYVVDGSAVNNAIIPLIGAESTNSVWGYFNAPIFPYPGRPADCELSAPADRKNWNAAAGPAQHLRPDRLWFHLHPCPGAQEDRPRLELATADRILGNAARRQALRYGRLRRDLPGDGDGDGSPGQQEGGKRAHHQRHLAGSGFGVLT